MSQIKNKKTPTLWLQCDKCESSIHNKDLDKHLLECPPNFVDNKIGFIQNNILCGTIDLKSNELVKGVENRDDLVFLSQGAIQLCDLAIGDLVVIKSVKPEPIVKIAWPTTEKTLTSVLLTKNILDLYQVEPGARVTVSKYTGNARRALKIKLIAINKSKSVDLSPELYKRIQKSQSGKIFTTNNRISTLFYGKILKFSIKSIESSEIDLALNLDNLSINDERKFYETNDQTIWNIFGDESEYEKSNRCDGMVLGGLEIEQNQIGHLMDICLKQEVGKRSRKIRTVLLYGCPGTGKTTLANLLANKSAVPTINIDHTGLYCGKATAEQTLKDLLDEAVVQSPCIVIIDEIDALCPAKTSKSTETEKRLTAIIANFLDNLTEHPRIFVIAITNKLEQIDNSFRKFGRFDREIEIPAPNPNAREAILLGVLHDVTHHLTNEDIREIAQKTHGYVGADLLALVTTANINPPLNLTTLRNALKTVKPSAMREVQIEVPNVRWSDIGGQTRLKLVLKQTVEWPLKHPESFRRMGVTPPKGVLMYGPPGCSKTMFARALATESGLNFLAIKGPELFSKWVGESERAVRELFRKARQVSPSIIFFDEIDALGGERSAHTNNGVQERVLAQLLTEMDGVTELGEVTVVAATNRPDRIDKALLRPGRLDRIVYVPLPDPETRREIFRIKLDKMPIIDVDLEELVSYTENYSGAELVAVCHEAAMVALEADIDARTVTRHHFQKALNLVTPRTPSHLMQLYEDYQKIKL